MKEDGWFIPDRNDWFNCTLITDENGKPKIDDKGRFYLKKDITNFSWGGKKPVKKTTKKKPVKKLKKGGVVNDPVDTNNNKTKNTNQNQKKQNLINMFINKNDKKTATNLQKSKLNIYLN